MSATESAQGVPIEVFADSPPPDVVICEFLDAMDPQVLEQLALNDMGWGDSNLTAKILETLKKLARGDLS